MEEAIVAIAAATTIIMAVVGFVTVRAQIRSSSAALKAKGAQVSNSAASLQVRYAAVT